MSIEPPVETDASNVVPPIDPTVRRRNRFILLAVIVMTLIGCGAIVYNAFAPVTEEPLDATSTAAVQHGCRAAYDELRTFGVLPPTATPDDRAALTERENGVFSGMVDAFARLQPPDASGRTALHDWIADWRALIARRADYAHQLRAHAAHPELVIPVDAGAPITNRMNQYARTHDAVGCETHNLQAEIVDGVRDYPNDPTASS
jgi:hypothetical protein